jgi:hypothetical protein
VISAFMRSVPLRDQFLQSVARHLAGEPSDVAGADWTD